MRTYHLSHVVLRPHPTAKTAAKVLRIKFRSFEDQNEIEIYAELYGGETIKEIRFNNLQNVNPKTVGSTAEDVAQSLISTVGDCTQIDFSVEDFNERVEKFEEHWKERAFRNALQGFKVTERLTLEQAIRVLTEHYVVEPIMEQ